MSSPALIGADQVSVMVETRGYTLEEVAIAFDHTASSLPETHLLPAEREAVVGDAKQRDVESK